MQLRWLSDYTRTLRTRITTLDSAHLSRGIAAFAALNLVPDDQLLRAYYMQLYAKLPLFDDQELSTTAEVRRVCGGRVERCGWLSWACCGAGDANECVDWISRQFWESVN